MKKCVLFLFVFSFTGIFAVNPLWFLENKNQLEKNVRYRAQMKGLSVFLEDNRFSFLFYNQEDLALVHGHKNDHADRDPSHPFFGKVRFHSLKIDFINSNASPEVSSYEKSDFYENFFLGNNKNKWASNVYSFQKVKYSGLWNGIDLLVYSEGGNMKYDYIVKPGADCNQIKTIYRGADKLELHAGNLYVVTSQGSFIEQKPYAYQLVNNVKQEVACSFVLSGNELSYKLGNYNTNYELVIDPTLVASTFSGSTADNWGTCSTNDSQGNIFMVGTVDASIGTYPTTVGAFDVTYNGGAPASIHRSDVAITKLDQTAVTRIYSTYLGGDGDERAHSVICNSNNELYLFGATSSTTFPTSAGCYDNSFNWAGGAGSGYDIFVTALDANGANLIGSTYIGGTSNDGINISPVTTVYSTTGLKYNYSDDARGEINIDASGNVFVATCTQSTNWPTTAGCIDNTLGGTQDAVIFKFDPTMATLMWSTYLGGSADDAAYGINFNKAGELYVTGGTTSNNFPTTAGSLNTTFQGVVDGFLCKIDNAGTTLMNSTYIGTTQYDQSYFVQLDRYDDVYVYGQTQGTWPVTSGSYATAGGKMFIQCLDKNLSSVVFSSRFGSNVQYPQLSPTAFLVDTCNNIYASGWGRCSYWSGYMGNLQPTTGMQITPGAIQSSTDGCDFYFIALSRKGQNLAYSTFFGSSSHMEHVDGGTSRFDKGGVLYQSMCAGCGGGSGNFITTPGVVSPTNASSNCNTAIVKIAFNLPGVTANAATNGQAQCIGTQICFSNTSSNSTYYSWDFGDGTPVDTAKAPCHTYTAPGTYTVVLNAIDTLTCNVSDTAVVLVTVLPQPTVALPPDVSICNSGSVNVPINPTVTGGPVTYTWTTPGGSDTASTIVATQNGQYVVVVSNGVCSGTDTMDINVITIPVLSLDSIPNVITPNGDGINELFKLGSVKVANFNLKIYNRWGNLIFETDDSTNHWNGKKGSKEVADGVYYYIVKYKDECDDTELEKYGFVHVLR